MLIAEGGRGGGGAGPSLKVAPRDTAWGAVDGWAHVLDGGCRGLGAAVLVLVSYPLHPPGKPDRLRTAGPATLEVPCLFVSGTRDAFGSRDELESATSAIPGPVTHVWLDWGDHGLRNKDSEVAGILREWLPRL